MRKWFRKWLGVDQLESVVKDMLVGMGKLTPEQAEEVVSSVKRDYKLINDCGAEGQL